MLTKQPQQKNEALDQASIELVSVRGEVSAAQNELAMIIENKKRIENEAKEKEDILNTQLDQHQKTIQEEIKKMSSEKESHFSLLQKHTQEIETVEATLAGLLKHKEVLETSISLLEDRDHLLKGRISAMEETEKQGRKFIAILDQDIVNAQSKKDTLSHELAALENNKSILAQSHADLSHEVELHKASIQAIVEEKKTAENQTSELKASIQAKKDELASLESKCEEVRVENENHRSAITHRDIESGERAGNLARLEARTEEKLAQLKEAKSEFTTEHLLRMGMKD